MIFKALAPKELVKVFEGNERTVLPPWDPMVCPHSMRFLVSCISRRAATGCTCITPLSLPDGSPSSIAIRTSHILDKYIMQLIISCLCLSSYKGIYVHDTSIETMNECSRAHHICCQPIKIHVSNHCAAPTIESTKVSKSR